MLADLSPARRRLVLGLVGLIVVAVVVAGGVALLTRDRSQPVSQRDLGPVLVVPGYGGDVDSLDPLVAELRREGRTAVVFRPTGGGTGDMRVQARRLGELAARAMRDDDASSVDVVAYSAGGIVTRLWVADDGADVVRRVVTLGSPHHGTDVAQLAQDAAGSCPTACRQLVPGSDLLRELDAGDETPAGPRWVTVRSSSDRTVTPTGTATLEGARNVLVQDLCPGRRTTHGELPGDPVTLATLRSSLGAAAPTRPRVSC